MDPLMLGLIVVMMIILYFLMIRPANKRAKEQRDTVNAIQPGSRVVLASGIFGTVRHVGDKQMVIELAPDCVVTVLKGAVVRPAEPDEEEFEYEDADEAQPAVADGSSFGNGATLAVPPETTVAQEPFYATEEPTTIRGESYDTTGSSLSADESYGHTSTPTSAPSQSERPLDEER